MNGPDQFKRAALISAETFRQLICDRERVSHGAFRVWHYLYSRRDKHGQCWPIQRDIAEDLGCKPHSLKDWLSQLESAGYLRIEQVGQNHSNRYTVLSGDGKSVLPEWATRRAASMGNTQEISRCPNGHAALPKPATPRVAQKGNLSKSQEVNSISKGESAPISKTDRISLERELERINKELGSMAPITDYPKGSKKHERVGQLKTRKDFILQKLGAVA